MPLGDESFARLVQQLAAAPARALPTTEASMVGLCIAERFEVRQLLGAGGMGVVYRVYDRALQRELALKLLRAPDDAGPGLLNEARALAKVDHPHVIDVYDVGDFENQVYMVMPYIVGPTLRRWVTAAAPAIEAIVEAYLAAARGLAAVHDVGLVHQDFKPDNVLVSEDGTIKVVDFGLAQASATVPLGGTPGYMAPEQVSGAAVDGRSDQYALVVAIVEAITGRLPGPGATNLEGVPRRFHGIVRRALSEHPGLRFPDMRALAFELERRQYAYPPLGRWWAQMRDWWLPVASPHAHLQRLSTVAGRRSTDDRRPTQLESPRGPSETNAS